MVNKCAFADVVQNLQALNVCQRCHLRYLGMKAYTAYANKITVEKALHYLVTKPEDEMLSIDQLLSKFKSNATSENVTSSSTKRLMPTPCAACLGILQDSCDAMVSKVETAVSSSGHVFKDFVLQLSVPVVIDLREHLIFLYLKEKLGDTYTFIKSDIPTAKDVWKWVVGSQFGETSGADFTPFSNFQISISITYPHTVKECLKLFEQCPEAFPNRKRRQAKPEDIYTRKAVMKAMETKSSSLKDLFDYPPNPPEVKCIYEEIECMHSPLYLGGRYNKYSRSLSQTPWVVDGERKMDSSVQELITDIVKKHILADDIVFSASGREDVDVKMLGKGRPFILELLNPRRIVWTCDEMAAIEQEINGNTSIIAVKNLQVISKQDTLLLKEGEEQKCKTYSALCLVEKILSQDDVEKLNNLKDLTLLQKTPLRVLHRRSLSTRKKMLHNVEATIINEHQLQLKLNTQAGTYVKEFVHGDFGRTEPSLGTLLDTRVDILELDVESIDLEWPPEMKR